MIPDKVHCKFYCSVIRKEWGHPNKAIYIAEFNPTTDSSEESKRFFDDTSIRKLEIGTFAEDYFEVGKSYHFDIDIIEAEA